VLFDLYMLFVLLFVLFCFVWRGVGCGVVWGPGGGGGGAKRC